ncbi:MAG: ABC transporter substrate-binding protein [Pseudomonadota bacterium]
MLKSLTRMAGAASVLALSIGMTQAQEVKVGSLGAVTGPIAELIAKVVDSRNLAAKTINDQGGLFDGQTYSLVLGDSACDPKAGVDAGNKVVNVDQVVAILGPSCSGATGAMVQSVSIPAGVIAMSDSATAPSITALEDEDTVFRVAPSDAYQGRFMAEQAMASGLETVAVTFANDDYNSGLARVFIDSFKELGGTITAEQMHEPNKPSYRSELATLSGGGDAQGLVLFAYYNGSGITIIRNALENALFEKFMAADGMFDDTVVEQIGAENLAGDKLVIAQAASDPDAQAYKAFASIAEEAGLEAGAPYVAHGYDIAFLMALAIEKAGEADRDKIGAALRDVANAPGMEIMPGEWEKAKAALAAGDDINYQGASGVIEFDGNGDVAGLYSLNTVKADGSWETVVVKD